jgi:hypothetical protein
MRARDFLKESKPQSDIRAIVKKFLPFVQQHLELSDMPEIELLDQPLTGTFGRYSDGNIRVMAHGRHPIDVLRTLAHELVHYKQDSEGRIHDESGETGSDEENEANAVAGVIMRDFDQAHPELLAALKESRVSEGAMSDLDLDIQDEHWDGIVGYVIHGLKTGISPGRMELYLYKWAGQEMFDLDEELQGRGFGSLYELVDHIQEHGGKYVNPTFDLDGLFGDDEISENFKEGKNPQDKGDSKRHGINTKASVSSLRKTAKSGGRKGQLAHWLANMKAGRAKKK